MKMGKSGFTLIEVAIFLAITGALFIAVTVGVQNSISQQRYNDAVQNFTEFLRNTYSEVSNVQNIKTGRTEKAIYGKLVTFGENADDKDEDSNMVYIYDVIGDIPAQQSTGTTLELLKTLKADVVVEEGDALKPAGMINSYLPRWAAGIEPICNLTDCEYKPFEGAVLIVRHPNSGTVYTFVREGATPINKDIKQAKDNYKTSGSYTGNILGNYLSSFGIEQIDFCVNPYANETYTFRRDVRIEHGARNASGVEIISDEDSLCVKE